MKQLSSSTTGEPSPARTVVSSIGLRRGEAGAATRSSAAVQWLSERRPAEVDKQATLTLQQRFGVMAVPRAIRRPGQPLLTILTTDGTEPSLTSLRSAAEWWCEVVTPAPDEMLSAALVELGYRVASRPISDDGADLQHAVYVAGMRAYPADVALAAIRSYSGTFWPALSELQAAADRMRSERSDILAALRYEQARLAREGSQ